MQSLTKNNDCSLQYQYSLYLKVDHFMNRITAAFFVTFELIAQDAIANDEKFAIRIYNDSQYNCDLQDYQDLKPIHGRLYSSPPSYLSPGMTGEFSMAKIGSHGASIRLTYQCENNHSITIRSNARRHKLSGIVEHSVNMKGIVKRNIGYQDELGHKYGEEIKWILKPAD